MVEAAFARRIALILGATLFCCEKENCTKKMGDVKLVGSIFLSYTYQSAGVVGFARNSTSISDISFLMGHLS